MQVVLTILFCAVSMEWFSSVIDANFSDLEDDRLTHEFLIENGYNLMILLLNTLFRCILELKITRESSYEL